MAVSLRQSTLFPVSVVSPSTIESILNLDASTRLVEARLMAVFFANYIYSPIWLHD